MSDFNPEGQIPPESPLDADFSFQRRASNFFLERLLDLEEQNRALQNRVVELGVDLVTGLPTRRIFDEEYSRLISHPRPERRSLPNHASEEEHWAFLLDIDDFGLVNKQHTEAVGDVALRRVAQAMTGQLRHNDIAGRYGGEELGAILPRTNEQQARYIAERVRSAIETEAPFDPVTRITASVGVGRLLVASELKDGLIQPIKAMRAAKLAGKNIVLAYDDLPSEQQ